MWGLVMRGCVRGVRIVRLGCIVFRGEGGEGG